MTEKLSEAKIRANKKWDQKNKERKKYIVKRSTAKGFVRDYATLDDLNELKEIMETRENFLKK